MYWLKVFKVLKAKKKNILRTLEQLFIDGCQGFYIGKPEPL
jgi:EAL domain-containing protein (putative c-di-GMP-specific phosphodiesterase class I)